MNQDEAKQMFDFFSEVLSDYSRTLPPSAAKPFAMLANHMLGQLNTLLMATSDTPQRQLVSAIKTTQIPHALPVPKIDLTVEGPIDTSRLSSAERTAFNIDDDARIAYYKEIDFEKYQIARANRVADSDGIKPYVGLEMFNTPEPTRKQWSTLTQAQKNAKGSVRF